jgi:hypothetical protein
MGVKLRIPVIVDQDSGKVGEVVSMHFTGEAEAPLTRLSVKSASLHARNPLCTATCYSKLI